MNSASSREPRHPIRVVADRTGLSQDVIRVWERRYGAVEPPRGGGGQRRYSDADIHRLQLLKAATRAGRGIGQVATMPLAALEALVAEDAAVRVRDRRDHPDAALLADEMVAPALAFTRAFDRPALEAQLRRGVALLGVAPFLEHVVTPFLRSIGTEWHAGRLNPAQEHLASATVQHLLEEITCAAAPSNGAPAILVTTPAGERHQIGAVLAGATAAAAGWRVIYLGPDLPAADIARAALDIGVRVVAISVVFVEDRARLLRELTTLRSALPPLLPLVAGGAGAVTLADELRQGGIEVVGDLAALRDRLETPA